MVARGEFRGVNFGDSGEATSAEIKDMVEKLGSCLRRHVVDIDPGTHGNQDLQKIVGDASFGAASSEIERSAPSVSIEKMLLERGKNLVLFGPNGAGKSTVFDAIMGRDNADFSTKHGKGAYSYGESIHGKDKIRVARLDQEEMLADIGEMTAQEVLQTAAEHYKKEFPIDWAQDTALENKEAQQRIEELSDRIAKLFDVDEFLGSLGRKVKELSGGERTKLLLLMILSSEPDILLLDEPTNHLDLESIAKLRGLFESYKQAGVSIVSVSHVEWFLESAGNDGVMFLRVEPNGSRNLQVSGSPYAKFRKSVEYGKTTSGQPIEWNRDYMIASSGSQLFSAKKEDGTITIPDSPIADTHLLEMPAGHVVVFSGRNGTGKTKLMEELVNRDSPAVKKEKGVQVAYMPQFWPEDIAKGSIRDFFFWVKDSVNPHSAQTEAVFLRKVRESSFSYDGTKSLLDKKFAKLSGGEQRLLWFIVASIFEGTDVLMLDEPTNHMDGHIQSRILETIRNFSGTIILSTHDLRLMQGLKEYAGKGREVNGVINLVFEKVGGKTIIKKSSQSPVDYSNQVIADSHKLAKRVRV